MHQPIRQAQGEKGFSQIILLSIIAVLVLAGAGDFLLVPKKNMLSENAETSSPENEKTARQEVSPPALGSLCSGKEACISFCLDNRGRCEGYCKGKGIELCKIIFPPQPQSPQPQSPRQQSPQQESSNVGREQNCVSNPNPIFTHAFADSTKLAWISQYGNNALYNPGSQARSYVAVKEGESTPVYAPVRATITRIYYSDKKYTQSNKEVIRPEYKINFQISCEVGMAYDHIISLADRLKAYSPQVSAPGKNDGVAVSIQVQAGELIGHTSGSFPGRAFDFLLLNKARLHPHLNPVRWVTDHSWYKTCPYDYFTHELKQQYYALIDEEHGVRSCGPRIKEVPNTAAGYWFQGNATESTKGDAREPSGPRFVIYGNNHFIEWTLIKSSESPVAFRTHEVRPPLPETVTEGASACYYDSERGAYVYLKMLADDKLGLVSGNEQCPSEFPVEYETWIR